ncbi:MAG: adenosylcobinamide-GDP ribazoletransferase [bacterium]|nr:adenosylcobinamide-GDP ribazoletransferase [bacterium]
MLAPLITAIRTLTLLPVPGTDTAQLSRSLSSFPWVGLILGTLLWLAGWGFEALSWGLWAQGEAVFLALLLALLTRALHLDGLADWADSYGAGNNREKALLIMKDSTNGAFGVVALVLYLLLWVTLATALLEQDGRWWLVLVLVLSRSMMVELMTAYPNARAEGTAGAFMAGAGKVQRWLAALSGLGLCYGLFGGSALAAFGLALGATHLFGWAQTKRLGGITGDLIGASCLINEAILLLFALLYRPSLAPWWAGWR